MRIRNFSLTDYDEVVSLWKECNLEIRAGDGIKEIRTKILRDPEFFLVAVEDGEIIGSVMGAWDGRRGWIYHLGVLPSYQRTGVASRLVKEVERRMKKKGVVKVNALVYEWNSNSLKFFKKMGYEADRTTIFHGKHLRRESP